MDMNALLPKDRPRLAPCCKYKKQPWLSGTLDTTYRGDFVGKEVPNERATKKQDGVNLFGPSFDGTTTMGNDFKVWEVKREGPIRPSNTDMGSHAPFEGVSTYKGDFHVKETPYELVKPKNAYKPNPAPLESSTTNRSDFAPREVPAPAKAITRGCNIPTSAGPFEGQSLYKDTFQKQPYSKRGPLARASDTDVLPRGDFDPSTMYGTSYVPKEVQRAEAHRPKDARPTSSAGWYGGMPSTEYRGQFLNKETPVAEPIRQARSMGVLPTGRFDGTTNNRADYVPHEVPATKPIRPSPAFEASNMPFQGQSTYAGSFVPKDVPYERVRPKNGYQPNQAQFDGTTTHRAAFVAMEVPAVKRLAGRGNNIQTGGHPFEGTSVYKDSFTKMPGSRRDKIAPKETGMESGPFNGSTTYNQDFVQKEIPARYIRARDDECESCVDGVPGVTCREL